MDEEEVRKRPKVALRVGYVHDAEYLRICDQLPVNSGRAVLVHELINAYNLLPHLSLIQPRQATVEELEAFHEGDYIKQLNELDISASDHLGDELHEKLETFGLVDDCSPFPNLFQYASMVAGGTIAAAKALCDKEIDVAINWTGGRHHAKRAEASGFCYVNDIVLGIMELQKMFDRVLYIDLDVHHGDGVESAFYHSSSVVTVSFHKLCTGFFPGSGKLSDIGMGKGRYHTINVPLKDGMQNEGFVDLVRVVLTSIKERFQPNVIVLQCGADGLYGDPWKSFNLSISTFDQCLQHVLAWNLPLLLLGGGGYNSANVARCWAVLTARCVNKELASDIPDHDQLTKYSPDFRLNVDDFGTQPNHNTPESIAAIREAVLSNISNIPLRTNKL